jgi:hypothetical protein
MPSPAPRWLTRRAAVRGSHAWCFPNATTGEYLGALTLPVVNPTAGGAGGIIPNVGGFVRILVLSDIHGNLDALEACLATAGDYDAVVNLGDIVGYGASPNEVIERSREVGKYFVRGNHDKASSGLMDLKDFNPIAGLAALWTPDQLTPQNLEWLRSLPQGPVQVPGLPDVQFVHGSPIDEDEYLVTPTMRSRRCRLCPR